MLKVKKDLSKLTYVDDEAQGFRLRMTPYIEYTSVVMSKVRSD